MHRSCLLVLAVAGCSFDGSGLGFSERPGELSAPDAAVAADGVTATAVEVCDRDQAALVACYRFEALDEPAQPHDDSRYGNHGTATGVTFVAGRPGAGQAMVTSVASTVRVADSDSLDAAEAMTMEVWVRPTTLPVIGRAGIADNNGQYGLFVAPSGEVRCAMGSNVLAGVQVTAGRWTHVACSFDGASIALYQDGVLTVSADTDDQLDDAGSDGLAIGHNSPSGDPFDGAIDDLRIWSTARTAQQLCVAAGADC